jgi:hypothetical protein
MEGVFISYRREDSAGHTGRLFDRLAEHLGKERVFMDISDIEPGLDFVETIEKALSVCEVLLVVIGRDWLSCTDTEGKRRLDDPQDFIRLETATSLRRDVRVIPVLVQGARMPTIDELPDDLQGLTRRQAIEISDTRWDFDTEQLIETLEKIVSPATGSEPEKIEEAAPAKQPRRLQVRLSLIALVAIALVGVAYFYVVKPVPAGPEVPKVVGQHVGMAKWALENAGFKLGRVVVKRTDKEKPGTVLSQSPTAGSALKLGTPVRLIVAEAPEQVQ